MPVSYIKNDTDVKSGDILLGYRKSISNKLISYWTNSFFVHPAVVMGDNVYNFSNKSLFTSIPLNKYLKKYKNGYLYRVKCKRELYVPILNEFRNFKYNLRGNTKVNKHNCISFCSYLLSHFGINISKKAELSPNIFLKNIINSDMYEKAFYIL